MELKLVGAKMGLLLIISQIVLFFPLSLLFGTDYREIDANSSIFPYAKLTLLHTPPALK
ncbi:hypothetical protein LguiA_016976 [Lonicera macranthoides]